MSAKAEVLGTAVSLEGAQSFSGREPLYPGIVILPGNNGNNIVAIKDSSFRPTSGTESSKQVYECDIVPLVSTLTSEETRQEPVGSNRKQGMEAELNIVDRCGDPWDLYSQPLPPEINENINKHPELWRNTLEVDGPPEESAALAVASLRKILRSTHQQLQEIGVDIDPASARMQDIPSARDMTPNPYVEVMVKKLGSDILKFIGVGVHEHFDINIWHAPRVLNYVRSLAPILNLGLHAAPFGFGQITPNLSEILNNEEFKVYNGIQPSSLRYLTRYSASPDGGVGKIVAHENAIDALMYADRLIRESEISNPARLYGSHADGRLRFDPPSKNNINHPGRVEVCAYDSGALRFETLLAYSELSRAVINRLEEVVVNGEQAISELHNDLSELFGPTDDIDKYAATQLETARYNSIEIAYHGANARIYDGNGREISAREQLKRVIAFAQGLQKDRLSREVTETLMRSVASEQTITSIMRAYTDVHDLPSLNGYYETGYGTPSQWMIARATTLKEQNKPDRVVMQDGTLDRAKSFTDYLEQ